MHRFKMGVLLLSVVMIVALGIALPAPAAEQPRYGGVLRVAIAGDPPSLDMHQEQTFKALIPMSTCYNTLIQFDPHGFPGIMGDLAKAWTVSDNGMTYTLRCTRASNSTTAAS